MNSGRGTPSVKAHMTLWVRWAKHQTLSNSSQSLKSPMINIIKRHAKFSWIPIKNDRGVVHANIYDEQTVTKNNMSATEGRVKTTSRVPTWR